MTISAAAALLGGALALLSPCSALLIPAFFASSSGVGARLAVNVGMFFLGLLTVLVPLGVGAQVVGGFFTSHRTTLIWVAGVVIIAFGVMQLLGLGFDMQRLMPSQARTAATQRVGLARSYLLGTSSGVAGFCAGPILGAVLTLSATSGSIINGGFLMVMYSAGMVAPLLVLVIVWHHSGVRTMWRGKTFTIAGRAFHTTSVLTGAIFIALGVVFITTNGLVGLPEVINLQTQASWQVGAQSLGLWGQLVTVLAVTAVAFALWWWWPRRQAQPAQEAPADRVEGEQ